MLKRVCIATGGTAGHILPALQLEGELTNERSVFFAGVNLGSNPYFIKKTSKVKTVSGANFSKGIFYGLKRIFKGFKESLQFLRENKIQVVVGFGSFHSFPILLAAKCLRLDLYLYESNLFAGRVNRLFSRFAKKTFVVFEETKNLVGQIECVGFTLCKVKKGLKKNYEKFGLDPNKKTILCFGGSLGSDVINQLSLNLAKKVSNDVQFIHLVGNNNAYKTIKKYYAAQNILHFVTDFHLNMHELYSISDMAITRSGANTIAEQIQFEVPSIHIPFAAAVRNHQEFNARFMQDEIKGSIMFSEDGIDEDKILSCVEEQDWIDEKKNNLARANRTLSAMQLAFLNLVLRELVYMYYLMGISGVGMSALANCLLDLGYEVCGSDILSSKYSLQLEKRGVKIDYKQSSKLLQKGQRVFCSSSIDDSNIEIVKAKKLGLRVSSRSKLLQEISCLKSCISVTGAHGKSTTSCLLSHILNELGSEPSYILGATTPSLQTNGRFARGQYLVCEADESDASNVSIDSEYALILNYDCDHLNFHKTEENLKESYKKFIKGVKKEIVYCADDPFLASLRPSMYSYGFNKDCFARAFNLRIVEDGMLFDCCIDKQEYLDINLHLLGDHNVLNALAILVLMSILKFDLKKVISAFATFLGTIRRLEKRGLHKQALFYDDYAHHPNEIRATLDALKKQHPKRKITSVFEPHSLYRFMDCADDFCKVFRKENVILTDVFDSKICKKQFLDDFVKKLQKVGAGCEYIPKSRIKEHLEQFTSCQDLVLTLGAGDLFEVHNEF